MENKSKDQDSKTSFDSFPRKSIIRPPPGLENIIPFPLKSDVLVDPHHVYHHTPLPAFPYPCQPYDDRPPTQPGGFPEYPLHPSTAYSDSTFINDIMNFNQYDENNKKEPPNGNYLQYSEAQTSLYSGPPSRDSPFSFNSTCSHFLSAEEPDNRNLAAIRSLGSLGTYSHFGPTNATFASSLSFGQRGLEHLNNVSSFGDQITPSINVMQTVKSSLAEVEFQENVESKIRDKQESNNETGFIPELKISIESPKQTKGSMNRTQNNKEQRESSTPTMSSRPETPVKPSYSEVLSKKCPASFSNTKRNSTGDLSNGSREPSPLILKSQNQFHRKSLDGLSVLSSTSTSSNTSTASSSPISKPRLYQKGKENNSDLSESSNSSSRRNTPTVSPVHQFSNSESAGKKMPSPPSACFIRKLSGRSSTWKNFEKETANGVFGARTHDLEELSQMEVASVEKSESGITQQVPVGDGKFGSVVGNRRKEKRRSGGLNVGSETFYQSSSSERRGTGLETSKGITNICGRKGNVARDKLDKTRSRREERHCAIRRLKTYSDQWINHLLNAATWFWSLLLNVTSLSLSLGCTTMKDMWIWLNEIALPVCLIKMKIGKQKCKSVWNRLQIFITRKKEEQLPKQPESYDELLSALGCERNILLPANGDEALGRLLSVRGQDPYSILGVRSDCSDETIRRHYKRQAVLVHPDKNLVPGAEEAFKILARAFELVGEPAGRQRYHQQLVEAHTKERFMGEFGDLFEELRKKMETAFSTMRCTKCKERHRKNKTSRPLFAARYCAQCKIHHGAREGELWAEKSGILSISWQFYVCMGNQIWEINEWSRCQRSQLTHLKPNAHNVIYRLVTGEQTTGKRPNSANSPNSRPHGDDSFESEIDAWDALINDLRQQNSGNATPSSNSSTAFKGSAKSTGNCSFNPNGSGVHGSSYNTGGKKGRKGKRK